MKTRDQLDRLVALGVPALAGLTDDEFFALGSRLEGELADDDFVAISPQLLAPRLLAPLLRRCDKPGFVVEDLTDLDDFVDQVSVPDSLLYVASEVSRGDDLRNWSPNDALAEFARRERSPMTLSEGISWLLHRPERLERDHCFMCIGTRKPKAKGLDSRTPALWISNGTGRDGKDRRDAPKLGWCWAGNRHTWLGIASVGVRR